MLDGGFEVPALCGRLGEPQMFSEHRCEECKGVCDHSPKNGPQEEKLKSQDFAQEMMRVWTRGGSDSRQNSGRGDSKVLGEGLILYVFVCTFIHRRKG